MKPEAPVIQAVFIAELESARTCLREERVFNLISELPVSVHEKLDRKAFIIDAP